MSKQEAAELALEAKLKHITITCGKTERILASDNHGRIERHRDALNELVKEADTAKRTVEGLKIASGENVESISEWEESIENTIGQADNAIEKLRKWLMEVDESKKAHLRKDQLNFEKELYETKLHYKTQLEESKRDKPEETGETNSTISGNLEAKLPKLVISKFNGSYKDWPRFWNQFSETIDKSNISNVTKFSYLRELLEKHVKYSIEALPFTSEGYNRAKSILQSKYGKESEVIKAYTKEILDLPNIPDANVQKVHKFCERLTYCVQSLETMGKLEQINGSVAMTLDKLSGIRSDLVRTDPNWDEWDYIKLIEALTLWTRRNPRNPICEGERKENRNRLRERVFNTKLGQRKCVYCDANDHKSADCSKVTDINERKQILAKKRRCFNCTGEGHRAADCTSKITCQHCERRHHTSLCEQAMGKKTLMTATKTNEGVFPILTVKVNGIMCRALVDSGAGSSYASAKLVSVLGMKPADITTKQVDMLLSSSVERLETYATKVESLDGEFGMEVDLIKVEKSELLSVKNPQYSHMISKYSHLKGVDIQDGDTRLSFQYM
ncbi:uncharacterized protein LOC124437166 [Xenia sp. Carnegie-2017]|uniref:uncharacterized protein LOC124437166 n=1 Tax=Xenia sp. Carnegie-2017 TaxID=2897299 RepID=UPI001F04DF46|nr:uncharacterized protein LOC124437166 [Xenia sp. Carnegie-2017]